MKYLIRLTIKTEIVSIFFTIISVFFSFYFYYHFPSEVATHWNFAGQPDQYSSRAFAAFFFPGIILGVYILFLFLPLIDPQKEHYQQFAKTYHIFKTVIVGIMVAIYFIASFKNLGYNLAIDIWVSEIVGLVFIIIGNYLPKIKPNWFIGIRTPWTLSNKKVWYKTHRFGGKLFVVGGLVMMLMPLLPIFFRAYLLFLLILLLVFLTIGSSYIYYAKQLKNDKQNK